MHDPHVECTHRVSLQIRSGGKMCGLRLNLASRAFATLASVLIVTLPAGPAWAGPDAPATQADCRNAQSIQVNREIPGNVQGTSPRYFRFTVSEGTVFQIYTVGELDTVGTLLDGNCRVISENDDESNENRNFRINENRSPGTYYVMVRGYGQNTTGSFSLYVNAVLMIQINVPSSYTANLIPGEAIFYRFEASATGRFTVYSTGSVDLKAVLLDMSGSELADDDDGGEGTNFRIERDLSPGTYLVLVSGYNQQASGNYSIHTQGPSGAAGAGAGCTSAAHIAVDGSASGHVRGTSPLYFRFSTNESAAFQVYTTGEADTVGAVLDGNCRVLVENDDATDSNRNFRIDQELAPGTYYVMVRGYGQNTTGQFILYVSASQMAELDVPGSYSANLRPGGRNHFSFEARTSGRYTIYSTGSVDLRAVLVFSGGVTIAVDDDCGEGTNFRIEHDLAPGTYLVGVVGYNERASGPYSVHIMGPSGAAGTGAGCSDALSIPAGAMATSSVRGRVLQYFSFQVNNAGSYRIYTTGDTDTVGQLLDSYCQVIADNDDGGEGLNFLIGRFLSPGTYYVSVRGYGESASGEFDLHIERD